MEKTGHQLSYAEARKGEVTNTSYPLLLVMDYSSSTSPYITLPLISSKI